MRHWRPSPQTAPSQAAPVLAALVQRLGDAGFAPGLLEDLGPVLPAASWSVYRTGQRCRPTLFMSASRGVPDTTRDCWWAYLSGPYRSDQTWGGAAEGGMAAGPAELQLWYLTAAELQGEHRARVYEAHGMAERMSVVEHEADGSVFAVNFYRHQHQRPFSDRHISDFEDLAPVLLALARKHIHLSNLARPAAAGAAAPASPGTAQVPGLAPRPVPASAAAQDADLAALRTRLVRLEPAFTQRELDVCSRLLQGMTHEGIAADLGVGVPTVKTYRNRAFARLGIHFRNELFARVLGG